MAFIPICKFQCTRKIHPEARLVFCLRRIDSLFVFFDYYCDCIVLKLAMLEKRAEDFIGHFTRLFVSLSVILVFVNFLEN